MYIHICIHTSMNTGLVGGRFFDNEIQTRESADVVAWPKLVHPHRAPVTVRDPPWSHHLYYSGLSHMNESCLVCGWVMAYTYKGAITDPLRSHRPYYSHVVCHVWISDFLYVGEWWHTHQGAVRDPLWWCHLYHAGVSRRNESCHICELVMSCVYMCDVTHIKY